MSETQTNFDANAAKPTDDVQSETIQWNGSTLSRADAMAFVGPNFNRFWFQWRKMAATGSSLSWNWASALFGVAWLGSRRMHKLAALVLTALGVLWFLAGASAGPGNEEALGVFLLVFLATAFVAFGLIGNALYRRHASRAVQAAVESESTPESRITHLRLTGGRSFAMGIGWAVGAYLLLGAAINLGVASSSQPVPVAAQAPAQTTTPTPTPAATPLAPQSPNDRYFTQERFYSPAVMRMLYESNIAGLNSLPEQARGPVAIYAISAADQVEEVCGEYLSIASTAARGILRLTVGVVSVGAAIEAISQESDRQAMALRNWFEGIQSIGTIDTQARRDVTVFLRDARSCTEKRVFQLKDGLDIYFRS